MNAGERRQLYHFRDEQGLEVDFVVPGRNGAVRLVECKASSTPTPSMAVPLVRLAKAFAQRTRGGVEPWLVHDRPGAEGGIAPGVEMADWRRFVEGRAARPSRSGSSRR